MDYVFNTELAVEFGVEESIMLHNVVFWIEKNAANNKHLRDNRYWTYNSISAFAEMFPFWSEGQVRRIIKSLISKGAIITGNYNDNKYDRTMWYALTDGFIENHKSICVNQIIHLSKLTNGDVDSNECIYTDVNTDICTDINTDSNVQPSRNNNGVTETVTVDNNGERELFATIESVAAKTKSRETKRLFANSKFADINLFMAQFTGPEYEGIDIAFYYGAVADWSASKLKYSSDWIATARGFIRRDMQAGKVRRVQRSGGLTAEEIAYLKM